MRSETHLHFFYAEELINTLLGAETEGSPFYHMFSVVLSAPPPATSAIWNQSAIGTCVTRGSVFTATLLNWIHTHTHEFRGSLW